MNTTTKIKSINPIQWVRGNLYLWRTAAPESTRLFGRVETMSTFLFRIAQEPLTSPRHAENVELLTRQADSNVEDLQNTLTDMRKQYEEYLQLSGKKSSAFRKDALAIMQDKLTTALFQQQLAKHLMRQINEQKEPRD